MTAEETINKKPTRPQRFKQESSKKFDTYTTAKMVLDTLNVPESYRKRIRHRADDTFDVVVYKPLDAEGKDT